MDDIHRELGDSVSFRENSEVVFAHHPLRFESQRMQCALRRHQPRFFVRDGQRFLWMRSTAEAFVGVFVQTREVAPRVRDTSPGAGDAAHRLW